MPSIRDYYGGVEYYNIGGDREVSGTRESDLFVLKGSYVTVNAYDGSDTIYIWDGSVQSNLIYAGGGADEVGAADYNTVYGEGGNDVIEVGSYNFIDAGDGDDVIDLNLSSGSTVAGGNGNDTFKFRRTTAVITDLSNGDIIRNEASDSRASYLTYTTENGNIVLKDTDPTSFQITLQGVTDISQVADVQYRTQSGSVRLGSLATTSSGSSSTSTTSSGSSTSTTTPAASSTSTTPAATTPSSSGGNTTIINIGNGGTYIGGDNNGTINYGTINNIEGLTVNNNTITVSNEFTQNLSLASYSQYSNVINIDGSQLTEAKLLSGNSNDNSIQAGSAGSTLYGGGQGNNTLSGGSGRDFFEFTGSGNDLAQNFTAGTGENSDVVYLTGTSLSSIRRDNNYLSVNTSTGKSLQVSNSESVDEAIQYSTNGTRVSAAKIGRANQSNSFTYEDGVNYYRGGNYTDVLNVTSYESRNIRLNRGTFSGINNIDASTSTGNNTLAGDSSNNQITAGQGNDSLWGGSGSSSDTLIGGSNGSDTFFYGKNDGADVIQNASSSDTVNLYNVRVSDISSARVVGNTIMANFKTGGSLQINGTSSMSSIFKLASGSQWQYNGSRWQRA